MKNCDTCKKPKDLSEFNKNKDKKDGLNSICKECSRIRSRRYYAENHDKHIKVIIERNKILEQKLRKIVNSIKGSGCQVCSEKDIACIDFHHIFELDKDLAISVLLGRGSKKRLKEELLKCALLCSNCHRKLHFYKQNLNLKPLTKQEIDLAFGV